MSHHEIIQNESNYFSHNNLSDQEEPVSAATGNQKCKNGDLTQIDQCSFNKLKQSELLSYEGGPENMLNDKLIDKSTHFSNENFELNSKPETD